MSTGGPFYPTIVMSLLQSSATRHALLRTSFSAKLTPLRSPKFPRPKQRDVKD